MRTIIKSIKSKQGEQVTVDSSCDERQTRVNGERNTNGRYRFDFKTRTGLERIAQVIVVDNNRLPIQQEHETRHGQERKKNGELGKA